MDESQEVVPAEVSAPEQVATAAPETVELAPEAVEPAEAPKTFTQEELDAAIGKRLAREQRKWEREQAARQAEMQAKRVIPADLPPADSLPPEQYAELLAERKAEELLAEIKVLEERNQMLQAGIDEAGSEAYWEEKAREQGYEKEGEQTVVVLPPEGQEEEKEEEPKRFWDKIKEKFGF